MITQLNQLLSDPVMVYGARAGIALLFAFAVWSKLKSFSIFKATLADYELVPKPLVGAVSALIVILELSIAVGVWIPGNGPWVMMLAMMLLLLYATAIATNLIRGRRDIDCGCTGPAVRQSLSSWLLVRNTVLVSIASLGSNTPSARETGILDFVFVSFLVVVGGGIYAAANQLMVNAPKLDALDALMETN